MIDKRSHRETLFLVGSPIFIHRRCDPAGQTLSVVEISRSSSLSIVYSPDVPRSSPLASHLLYRMRANDSTLSADSFINLKSVFDLKGEKKVALSRGNLYFVPFTLLEKTMSRHNRDFQANR